jgi:hypothetical protein
VTWKGPVNFWMGGRRSENTLKNTTGGFNWCSLENSTELVNDHVRWQPGQPDNLGGNQNCLHLKILKKYSNAVVSDRNCSSKFTFACQVRFSDLNCRCVVLVYFPVFHIKMISLYRSLRRLYQLWTLMPLLVVLTKVTNVSGMYVIQTCFEHLIYMIIFKGDLFFNISGSPDTSLKGIFIIAIVLCI